MSTWPNRGASGGPCGGLKERESRNQATNLSVRPIGSDSSQQASSKPGAVHYFGTCPTLAIEPVRRACSGDGDRPAAASSGRERRLPTRCCPSPGMMMWPLSSGQALQVKASADGHVMLTT